MYREKRLCFSCDDKFSRGHRCSAKIFLLIAYDDNISWEEIPPDDAFLVVKEHDDQSLAQISFHAIYGHLAPETLRLVSSVSDKKVLILVDGGSTHNFIQEHLVTTLDLYVQSTQPLHVMVGNGNEIACKFVGKF